MGAASWGRAWGCYLCTNPASPPQLLRAAHLVLSACNINVVLGVDWDIMTRAVWKELKDEKDNASTQDAQSMAEAFVRKIIQLPVDVCLTTCLWRANAPCSTQTLTLMCALAAALPIIGARENVCQAFVEQIQLRN